MQKHIIRCGLAALLAATAFSPAQAREDRQFWSTASANIRLSPKWQLSEDIVARFSDNRNGLYEIEAATLIGYKLSKTVTVAAGYVHNPQYSEGDFTTLERRAREQISFDNIAQLAGGKFSARMRMEQRWRDNADGTAWRVRPYLKYSLPLTASGKTSLTLSNETFVNLVTTSFQRTEGFDRMRNQVSVSTKLTPKLSLEGGYLNQYGFVRNGDDTIDHVATLSVGLSL